MDKNNQQGFSIIEVLLVLVAIGILGFAGWYVYHAKQVSDKNYAAATSSTVPTFKKKSNEKKSILAAITAGPSQGFDTYTNPALGFSFVFPTTTLAFSGCGQNSTVHDTHGDLIPAPTAYVSIPGLTSLTVLNDGDNFWIAPASVIELTGEANETIDGNQYARASGCEPVTDTPQLIEQTQKQTTVIPTFASDAGGLPFTAKIVKQGSALNSETRKIFSDSSLQVSKLTPDSSGSWDDLSFTCSKQSCAQLGGSYTLRYYPTKNLLIFWNTGQSCNLFQSDAADAQCYDSQVISSFKLL